MSMDDKCQSVPQSEAGVRRSLWRSLVAVALLLGLAVTFAHTFAEMWTRWFPAWRNVNLSVYDRIVKGESYYTHGPLIPLVSLVIALLLIRHTRIPVKPSRGAGLAVLGTSLLLHLMACFARVNFVSGFAFIGVLMGLVLLLWGWAALRRLWFPIALLVFMVPLPEVTIAGLNFHLKMLATKAGVGLAGMLGVLAAYSGNRVVLQGDKSLIVANVCNGLRTLISLLAFGALYAYVCRLRGLWRLGLFAMSIPVAVVSNSLRVASLIVVADVWSVEAATGWYHDTSGILIFFVAFAMMFGIERLILWVRQAAGRPAQIVPLFHDARKGPEDKQQWSLMTAALSTRTDWAALVLVMVAAAGAFYLTRVVPPMRPPGTLAMPRDMTVDGRRLQGYRQELDDNTLTILETRDYAYSRYAGAGVSPVDVCVIFSEDNRKGTHPPDLCLQGSGEGIVAKGEVLLDNVPGRGVLHCREIVVQSGSRGYYYLYTYKCGDKYTGSFWGQQYAIFVNGLLSRNASGALVRISTPVDTNLAEARRWSAQFMRQTIPYLDNCLAQEKRK